MNVNNAKLTLKIKHSSLFIAILVMLMLKDMISYNNVEWSMVPGSTSWEALGTTNYFTISLVLASLFCVIALSCFFYEKNKNFFSSVFNLNLFIIIFAIIGWTFISFATEGVQQTLYSSSNPLVYLTVLAVIIGTDDAIWNKLSKAAPLFAALNILLSFYSYFPFASMNVGLLGGNSPTMTYFVSGFWFLAVAIIDYENKSRKSKILIYTLLTLCITLAVIINSRSWVIQSTILLFIAAFISKNKRIISKLLITCIIIALVSSIAYFIIDNYYVDYLVSFTNKLERDTRSFQYEEIFSQIPFYQFIFGGGIDATYQSSLYGDYRYIDNQYIMALFHYGILIFLPYVFFFVSSAWKLWKCNVKITKKIGCFIVFLWLLALGGLSIYNVIIIDFKSILLPMVAGRCLFLSKEG